MFITRKIYDSKTFNFQITIHFVILIKPSITKDFPTWHPPLKNFQSCIQHLIFTDYNEKKNYVISISQNH